MKARSKSSLFLMELIVVILFFSLASTVCIQLFVKSHLLGKDTEALNNSVLQAQNLAEVFLGYQGDFNAFIKHFPFGIVTEDSLGENDFYLMLDESFQETSLTNSCIYYAFVHINEEDNIHTANIEICSIPSGETIESTLPNLINNDRNYETSILYSLSVDKYVREGSLDNE